MARLDVLQAEVELANARGTRRIQARAQVQTAMQALRSVLSLPQSQPLTLRGRSTSRSSATRATSSISCCRASRLAGVHARRDAAEYVAPGRGRVEAKPVVHRQHAISAGFDRIAVGARQSELCLRHRVERAAVRGPGRRGAAQRRAVANAAGRAWPAVRDRQRASRTRVGVDGRWKRRPKSSRRKKALELARESVSIAQVSYESGVITSAELNDAQVRLLQTEWLLMQAKYAHITAAARAKVAAGI